MRHLIDPLDFTLEETKNILDLADRIKQNPDAYSHVADGKRIATLFYEPSTRTRLSFESAMLSLGGQVIGSPVLKCQVQAKVKQLPYFPRCKLLRRYYCNETSKRRCSAGCINVFFNSCNKCR